jgi:hypothetical protein
LNLRPLGYEQADPRLMHPTVAICASGDARETAHAAAIRLIRSSGSRHVLVTVLVTAAAHRTPARAEESGGWHMTASDDCGERDGTYGARVPSREWQLAATGRRWPVRTAAWLVARLRHQAQRLK